MAEITTSQIGNGTTAYGSDIVVKDLDLDVSNRVKDDTPVLNMCMSKKRKVNSTLPLWTDDIYRLPAAQAVDEGAAVSAQTQNPISVTTWVTTLRFSKLLSQHLVQLVLLCKLVVTHKHTKKSSN